MKKKEKETPFNERLAPFVAFFVVILATLYIGYNAGVNSTDLMTSSECQHFIDVNVNYWEERADRFKNSYLDCEHNRLAECSYWNGVYDEQRLVAWENEKRCLVENKAFRLLIDEYEKVVEK